LKGYNQPWAYVTVTCPITEWFQLFGRSEADTNKMLQKFISELVPVIEKPSVVHS